MNTPEIFSKENWNTSRKASLSREKELTKQFDRLAAERRQLPWMEVDDAYRFYSADREASLRDLFDGQQQLIVYHHMLKKDDPSPCSGCCMVADSIPHLAHLKARHTNLIFVSKAPVEQIDAFSAKMGWQIPWYETRDSFNSDQDVTTGFGINVFIQKDGKIFRTYFTSSRGVESLGSVWSFLDLTPMGRSENWQKAPGWVTQDTPYRWWRRHDEY